MANQPQPAKKSYFFGKGYRDLGNTIKGAWSRNADSIKKYVSRLRSLGNLGLPLKLFLGFINILAILAVIVFGSVMTAGISLINILVLLVFMTVVYLGFTVIWIADRLYLLRKRIFTACHECKEKSLIPTYLCPDCGAKHTNLTPGVYGIIYRTCNCGHKLPTVFFKNRKSLEAECTKCGKPLSDKESRPICIPIVGGRSVGKTAFITAFSHDFIESVVPSKGFTYIEYSPEKGNIYDEILRDYSAGSTRMTNRPSDINIASAVSFSFFVRHPKLSPDRLVHVYDIAGEVFTDHAEHEIQKQYEYCHGIVVIIDPFAIPAVRAKYEDLLESEDIAGIGKADIGYVIDSFLNKLRQVTGLSETKMSRVPLAVVISKIDSACLDQDIGRRAVNKKMASDPQKFNNFYDTQDYLCREFLKEHDMEDFLANITMKFKTNRFFACSAIGHTRDKGAYKPEGVLPPMEWLFRNADSKMGELWYDNPFTKNPLAIDEK